MANRSIEMHEHREALYRMRRGERDRQISRDGVLGRHKLSILRTLAAQQGWLEPTRALPPERSNRLIAANRAEETRVAHLWQCGMRCR